MKGTYCETREEYIVSKNLFKRFLTTPSLHVGARKILVTNIITWFKSYVEVHEDHYSYYKKSNSLCFGEYSNSVVEGVHNDMKHSSAPILPSHSLHRAVAILSKNTTRKEESREKSSIGKHGSRTYNKTLELNDVLDYAYVRIEQCLRDTIKYINLKTSHDTFLVTRNFATFPYTGCAHIPRFRRVRKVTFRHGKLCCDCHSSSVWGMLCVHSLNVARTCDASYVPSKCDISCIWWKTYQDVATNLVTDESSVDCLLKLFALLKKGSDWSNC